MSAKVHDDIAQLCDTSIGIGIRLALVEKLFGNYAMMVSRVTKPLRIIGKKVAFSIRIDPATLKPPKLAHDTKTLDFENVEVTLDVHDADDPATRFTSITFNYALISSVPYVDQRSRLRLQLKTRTLTSATAVPDRPDPRLLEDHKADFPGDDDESRLKNYKFFEYMLTFNSDPSIAEYIVSGVEFPDVLRAMGAFKLAPPVEVGFTDDYLVLKSDQISLAALSSNCPKVGDAKSEVEIRYSSKSVVKHDIRTTSAPTTTDGSTERFQAEATLIHQEARDEGPGEFSESDFDFVPDETGGGLLPGSGEGGPGTLAGISPIVLYLPKGSLDLFSTNALDGIEKGVEGHGSCIAYYDYAARLRIDGPVSAAIVFTVGLPNLKVNLPRGLFVSGHASVGVEILCVRIEIIGVKIEGPVRPIEVLFSPQLSNGNIVLNSRLARPIDVKLDITGSFPLGMIVALLTRDLIHNLVYNKITDFLNSFRVTLVDLKNLGIDLKQFTRVVQSVIPDHSVLIGVETR